MKIDLGCGKHPRGDIGVDYGNFAVVTDTSPLDKYFEPYGFKYNPNAEIYDMRIETFVSLYKVTKLASEKGIEKEKEKENKEKEEKGFGDFIFDMIGSILSTQ